MAPVRFLALAAVLTLLASGAARSADLYTVQPIATLGDKIGNVVSGGHFDIGALNDQGQLVFVTETPGGQALLQYTGGQVTPIVVPGGVAPGGKWGAQNSIPTPVSMNQLGNIVFGTDVVVGNSPDIGTFLWDYKAQKATAVALKGMPAAYGLSFEVGNYKAPAINNQNEIAFAAVVKNAEGEVQPGVFLLGQDGKLLPIAIPDQPRPGGGQLHGCACPYINDAGRITFLADRISPPEPGPGDGYVWELGTITPVVLVGTKATGGGTFAGIWGTIVNSESPSVLVDARVDDPNGAYSLYLSTDGKLLPCAVPGTSMPGGGTFKTVQTNRRGISFSNDRGQWAFLAVLQDGSTGAYRMEADGKLSLLLKSGMATSMGTITNVGVGDLGAKPEGVGIGYNSKGQIAVNVKINGGATTLVLLTPASP